MFFKAKLIVHKNQIFINVQLFNFYLMQDLKIAAFWENPENIWSTFSKIQQTSGKQNFVKNQQNFTNVD